MSKKKTNVDYLREIIEKNMPEVHRDEAIEFLDGIQKEYDDFSGEVKDAEAKVKEAEDEAKEWEQKYDDLKLEYDILEDETEDGPESLQEEMTTEAFNKFVGRVGELEAERILDELNQAPYLKKANG